MRRILRGSMDNNQEMKSSFPPRRSIFSLPAAFLLASMARGASSGDDPATTRQPQTSDSRPPATASATTAPPATPTFTDTVTVLAEPVEAAGSAITTLDHGAITTSGAATVPDLLQTQAGLHVSQSGSQSGITTVEIRGGDPTFTLVLLDGLPLNDGTDSLGDITNLNDLALDEIESVEIVRGPTSSLYGSRALAGVVQLTTRRADEPGTHLGARVELGSSDTQRAGGAASWSDGGRDARLGVDWGREAGRVGDDRFERGTVTLNAGAPVLGKPLRLRGRWARWTGDDYIDGSGGPVLGDGALRHSESDEAGLALHWSLDERAARRQALDLAVYHHSMDRESPAIGQAVPASTADTTLTRLRAGWSGKFALGRFAKLNAGADLEDEHGESAALLFLAPGMDLPGDYSARRTTAGGFAGLSASRGALSGDATLRLDKTRGHDARWSPRASVSYAPRSWWRLRGTLGQGYKLPSFYALSSPRALGGNPALRPETSTGGDLGLDLKRGTLEGSVTLFASRYHDLIDFDYEAFQLINRAHVRARGVETSLAWSPAPALRLFAAVTRQECQDPDSTSPILHAPNWNGSGGVSWSIRSTVRLRLAARGVSREFDQQVPVPGRDSVSGRVLFDGLVTWKVAPHLTLEAHGENLAGREYETLIGFPGPRRSVRVVLRVGES